MTITAVVLAGGKGERFWPKSRLKLPKQFLNLTGHGTMIQETVMRIQKLVPFKQIYVVTCRQYVEMIMEQLPYIPLENILVEPIGRDTAPSIGLATAYVLERYPNSTMIVLPSDHTIRNETLFLDTLKNAIHTAKETHGLVTIGITPDRPETGYGYIQAEERLLPKIIAENSIPVKRFVEKPDLVTALEYVHSGQFLWNSGMFVWETTTIANHIEQLLPDLYSAMLRIREVIGTPIESEVIDYEYPRIPSISIDYGLMEKATNMYVVQGNFGWDDVGSWTALDRLSSSDDFGNVVSGNVVHVNTTDCIIESNDQKLIATLGIKDMIVINTDDVTLICSKAHAQDIKKVLSQLKEKEMEIYL